MQPRHSSLLSLCALVVLIAPSSLTAQEQTSQEPEHRVVAMYFHRTQRCPTCKRIGAYAEEAIKTKFTRELKQKKLSFHLIDFQDRKNEKYTKGYRISGPTLVLANVVQDKVTAWKPLPKVWSLVGKKDEFFEYVQNEIRKYLEGK